MTASRLVTIWCDADEHVLGQSNPADNCPGWIAHEPSAREARSSVAGSFGWKRIDGKDYSPQCGARLFGAA